MRTPRVVSTVVLLTLLPGCGLIDKIRGEGDDETGDEASEAGEAEEGAPDDDGEETDEAAAKPSPLVGLTGVDRFKHWAPRHAFIGAPTVVADAISEQELIVATSDAHVGVSKDGGQTWQWTKADDGVRDVTGYPGGPYVALHEGAISLSEQGLLWRRLPRLSSDSLIDVVAAEIGLVAIGKNGAFIHVGKDGSGGHGGWMPDKFKPKAVTELNGAVLAWSGKKGYGTTDGTNWTELEQLPPMPDGRFFLTSAGSCSISKVGKRRGVACSVSGTAHGIGEEFAVESKGVVALTRDGGETWVSSTLPFKGANSIFGSPGGPYYAIGNKGAVAISSDGGQTWVDQKWEESANLLDGVVSGNKIVIVGAKGTIIYSTNGGAKWDYSQPPISKSFSWVGMDGSTFVASDGRVFIASANLVDWVESEGIELPAKAGACDEGPEDGEACRYDAEVTTPEGMPEVRGLTFTGDVGLALGDDALVAVTNDGGASWSSAHGLDLGRNGATGYSVAGDQVLVTDGAKLLASADAGGSWVEGALVRNYKINAVHVVSEGTAAGMWLAAAKDEILAAKINPETWLPAGDEQLKGDWRAIFEVGGVVYVSGSKGQLRRSEDGNTWTEVITGISSPVIDMAGEGQTVWAATAPTRKSNNALLRSEDGGAHFILVQEMPGATDQPDLRFEGDALTWADLISRDRGESWRRETERYFPGLVDVNDGSGMQIANLVYRYSGDRLYVVTGAGEYDWVRIDSAFNEGGAIQCDPDSGCWMLASGVLYRPLGE
ncbi:Ycf48-like protein [Enhygromyxa salina]|uniref:Ycf48-like protein n=1 Tax=Enhygromyxa salina TaxID=215803 RepID=A0A2S9XUG8_9BACT|nr:hypothetical protein [Enhygromyxa salina]PRP96505.1 Ycf48-like protein [Enhygromyxa salina]